MISIIYTFFLSSTILAGGPSVTISTLDVVSASKRAIAPQNIVIATMPFTSLGKIFCLKNFGAGVAGLVDCTASNLNTLKQDPTLVFSYIPTSVPISGTPSDGVIPYNTTLKSAYDDLCVNFQGINSLTVSMAPCTAINGLLPWFIDWSAPSTVTLPPSTWSNSFLPSSKAYASPWVNPPNVVLGWSKNPAARYCFQKSTGADVYAGPLSKLSGIQFEKCDSSPENRQAWFSYPVQRPTIVNRTPDELAYQGDAFHNHMNNAVCNSTTNLRTGSGAVMSCEAMNNNVTVLRGNLDFTRGASFRNPFNQNDAFSEETLPRIRELKVPTGNWTMSFFLDLQSDFMTSVLPDDTFKNGLSNIFEFRAR